MMTKHVVIWLLTVAAVLSSVSASLAQRMTIDLLTSVLKSADIGSKKEVDQDYVNAALLSQAPPYNPPQCQKLACPPAKVLADRGSYRKVYFPEAPYAKSNMVNETMIPATLKLYKRLRSYINGENDKKETLPMTAPVILRMDPGEDGMFSPKNFTLFFYIDPSVTKPPKPTDDSVEELTVNSYILYIRTFSGYPVTYGDWMRELLQLAADVEADNEPYSKGYYYFASYDPPSKITSRTNEVQLLRPHHTHTGL